MKKTMSAAAVFGVLIFLGACNYRLDKQALPLDSNSNNADLATPPDQVDFQVVSEKVLSNCTSCHSPDAGNAADLNLLDYATVFQNRELIREVVVGQKMPPKSARALTTEQIQMLTDWIDAGAVEHAQTEDPAPPVAVEPIPTPEPVPAPAPVTPPAVNPPTTYDVVFKQVISPSCLKCHSAPGNAGGVNLETYPALIKVKDSVRKEIAKGSMPKRSKLTDQQKKLILDWLDAGAPEGL